MIDFTGSFSVSPSLPENLEPLREIAYNLFWTWHQEAVELFRRMDRELWESSNHNPVMMLGKINQKRLKEVSEDDGFVAHMNRVYEDLNGYKERLTWYQKKFRKNEEPFIAYFSAEFGLTECLQTYSGGLGVLAGDHMKSASDLGIPLVGIGLCYKEGFFQQYLTSDGWQQERYEISDLYNQPMTRVKNEDNEAFKIDIQFPGRKVFFQIWKIQIGNVPLYLLDTNVEENAAEDKKITRSLYGGDIETRIQQEIVLGIGGIRTLHAIGIKPLVCHMNEGHSAFLGLERIRYLIKYHGLSYQEARIIGAYSNIFTTHTPVPAGIDVFSTDLMEKYFDEFYTNELGIDSKEFYKLGCLNTDGECNNFNMAYLAMNMADFVNGVSKLHKEVSKKMWVEGFKEIPFDEIPIQHVTNGVHTKSHLSLDMHQIFMRYLGENYADNYSDSETWKNVQEIPDEELWRTHERRRERLVAFARKKLVKQVNQRGGSPADIAAAREALDASALTIGFAKRFATYKRANLIFRDLERLSSILFDKDRPVQILISGKAHPRDDAGKSIIQDIVSHAKKEHLRNKVVFLENYDMNVARYMVEGCDIWLNNPRRPLEASGTSGMKVIANGGMNFSVLDGWWDEAYTPEYGWKIGSGEEYKDLDYQDEIESRMIYEALEKEIVPLFYDRGPDRLPRKWIEKMKASMEKLAPQYNTHRMLQEYTENFYIPSFERRKFLMANNWEKGKEFAAWREKLLNNWDKIKFINVQADEVNQELEVGAKYSITAEIQLGNLEPDDVKVQIYYGKLDDKFKPHANQSVGMEHLPEISKSNKFVYRGEIPCEDTGNFGWTVRLLPKNDLLIDPFEMGIIRWTTNEK